MNNQQQALTAFLDLLKLGHTYCENSYDMMMKGEKLQAASHLLEAYRFFMVAEGQSLACGTLERFVPFEFFGIFRTYAEEVKERLLDDHNNQHVDLYFKDYIREYDSLKLLLLDYLT